MNGMWGQYGELDLSLGISGHFYVTNHVISLHIPALSITIADDAFIIC